MLNLVRKLVGKLQLPENLLNIKAQLKNYERPSILEERQLSGEDQQLLQRIRLKTEQLNVNNVTRTKAYLDFYIAHPEIHWAFLGHMVSRNGGWNMTDLKGEFLTRAYGGTIQTRFLFFFGTRELAYLPRCLSAVFTL